MTPRTRLAIVGTTAFAVLVLSAYFGFRALSPVETLTTIRKTSPDRKHTAQLVTRETGVDVNVILRVDGSVVYTSPDFAVPAHADFGEQIIWDRSGKIVVLAVGNQRMFGYHVLDQRRLSPSELSSVRVRSFEDLRFTEDLPLAAPASER